MYIDPDNQAKKTFLITKTGNCLNEADKAQQPKKKGGLRAVIQLGNALKSRYVASENNKADMHTKRLATVR